MPIPEFTEAEQRRLYDEVYPLLPSTGSHLDPGRVVMMAADYAGYWLRVAPHIGAHPLALYEAHADIAAVVPDGWRLMDGIEVQFRQQSHGYDPIAVTLVHERTALVVEVQTFSDGWCARTWTIGGPHHNKITEMRESDGLRSQFADPVAACRAGLAWHYLNGLTSTE